MKKAQKHFAIKLPRLDAQTLKALLPYIAIALLATKLTDQEHSLKISFRCNA